MNAKTQIKKIALTSLAIGVTALAGFGLSSTAFADDGNGLGVPDSGDNGGGVVYPPTFVPRLPIIIVQLPPAPPPFPGYTVYQNYPVYPNYQYYNPVYTYPYAYTTAISVQDQANLIWYASTVLGLPPGYVLDRITQGVSLTQVAAERGWDRGSFVNALTTRVQASINAGTYSGSLAAYDGLLSQEIGYLVDIQALGIVNGSAGWVQLQQTFP